MRHRRLLVGALVGALCALGPAGVADAAKKRPTCKRGQVGMVLKGSTVKFVRKAPRRGRMICVKRARPVTNPARLPAAATKLLRSKGVAPPYAKRLGRNRTLRALEPYARRMRKLVLARVRASATAARERTVSREDVGDRVFGDKDVPGGKAEMKTVSERAGEGETGSYTEADSEVGMSKDGVGVAKRQSAGQGGFMDRCPSAQGIVDGTVKFKMGEGLSAKRPGDKRAMSADWGFGFEAHVRAEVGADGRWKSFSYKGTGAIEARGYGADGRYSSKVLRLAFSNGPIPRGLDFQNPRDLEAMFRGSNAIGRGPHGDNLDAVELKALRALLDMADGLTLSEAPRALNEAENGWYDRAECLAVDFTPAGQKVRRGGSAELDATVRSKRSGAAVDGAPVTLTKCSAGELSTSSGPSTLQFVFSDPGSEWSRSSPPCVSGESVSRRGRATGSAQLEVTGVPVPLFDVQITIKRYLVPCGNLVLDDAVIGGSLTERNPDDEDLSRGSGTASGVHRTVSDCDHYSTTNVPSENVSFTAQYTTDGTGHIAVGWNPETTIRWFGFQFMDGNGSKTETSDDGDIHSEYTVTVSNLRPLVE